MAKKLHKTRIQRDNDYLYYIKAGAIWASPKKGKAKKGAKKVKVAQFCDPAEMDYSKFLYFIDKDGDVAVATRAARKKKK